jgi:hypothetical protein
VGMLESSLGIDIIDVDCHLYSGVDGAWSRNIGFGKRFDTKSWKEIDKYELFVNRIWDEIKTLDCEQNDMDDYW